MRGEFEIGQIVGRHELVDKIDAEGLGHAYRARNLESGDIELVRLLPQGFSEGVVSQRFMREVKILRSLTHPNIVTVNDVGHMYGRMYLSSELPAGATLERLLDRQTLGFSAALQCLRGILEGLAYVHDKNVVHRAIAPANVHVAPDGEARITGFSFACGDADLRFTSRGVVIGVPGYMSPEQAEGQRELDCRSDLYSAAAVLYQVVTGRRPFEAGNFFQLINDHRAGVVSPPAEVRPGIPEDLSATILKGLAKDPDDRFQSAGQFMAVLEGVEREAA